MNLPRELQMGIGGIPNAVLRRLRHKHDLGVHTEMFSDGFVDLYEAGAISNKYKAVHAGRTVTSFVIGTQRVFDFVDDNPLVEFTVQLGGSVAEAEAAVRAMIELGRRQKIGKRLGAEAVIKAERR